VRIEAGPGRERFAVGLQGLEEELALCLTGLDYDFASCPRAGDAPLGFEPFDVLAAFGECFDLFAGVAGKFEAALGASRDLIAELLDVAGELRHVDGIGEVARLVDLFMVETAPLAIGTPGEVRDESFFSSRRRHTILVSDWSSDVCSSD